MKARSLKLVRTSLLLFFIAAINVCAAGAVLTVTKTADTDDGVCDADCSLREAVVAAQGGDSIVFSEAFQYVPQTVALIQGQISITRDLSIQGPGASLLNVSGSNLSRIFNISNGANVAIARLTISNGREDGKMADWRGGGIIVSSSFLTLTNVVFHHNLARYPIPPTDFGAGGAVFGESSTINVTNCEFYSNTAASGGAGIGTMPGGTLRVTGSSFHNNNGNGVSGDGDVRISSSSFNANSRGGLAVGGTTLITDSLIEGNSGGSGISTGSSKDILTIDHCIIRNNLNLGAFRFGGGIASSGKAIIRSTVISGNRAGAAGGGISKGGTDMYIVDSSITGNSAVQQGGGIIARAFRLYIANSTVSSNQAPKGGGIHNAPSSTSIPSEIFLTNTTISFNNATAGPGGGILVDGDGIVEARNSVISSNNSTQGGTDVSGAVISGGFNLVQNSVGSTGWSTTDMLGVDPMLAPLGSNGGNTFTHALLPGSPAINAGSNALALDPQNGKPLTTDQRGTLRILGSNPTVDIGAYETNYGLGPVYFEGRILTASRAIPHARVVLTGGSGEPRYAVTNPSGYYRFFGIAVGQTYTLTASAKSYTFAAPLVVTADQDRHDLQIFGTP